MDSVIISEYADNSNNDIITQAAAIARDCAMDGQPLNGDWRQYLPVSDDCQAGIDHAANVGHRIGALHAEMTSGEMPDDPPYEPIPLPERAPHASKGAKAPHGSQLVPYGKHQFDAIANGWRPPNGIWVHLGGLECYDLAKEDIALYPSTRATMALPDNLDLSKVWWPHLHGLDVMLVCGPPGDDNRLVLLTAQLIEASCGRVTVAGGGEL